MIKVQYFGEIAELVTKREEYLSHSAMSVSEINQWWLDTYGLKAIPYSMALNQEIVSVSSTQMVSSEDEIAILPPFAGG